MAAVDKLNLSLDEVIKKDREQKKHSFAGKAKFRDDKHAGHKQRPGQQRFGDRKAPNARDKARQLRKNKVEKFGRSDGAAHGETFRNGKVFSTKGRQERADRENWRKDEVKEQTTKPLPSNKLKVSNLNNSISNEDLNVLFRNIGPLSV
eukprot:CAMPEP_0168326786 /NCGR_PEP_ID=MMETSP0213-20121227/5516_1 /TAXON_ID=151035 /ORGANISM="Euplotes harpa, Strain FSP1.4" /LENGTH=148 /DNA_ID=CAMNT_0008329579 /DNA_START=21 /DNA_END=467 /DNA_ORIENTATION=-